MSAFFGGRILVTRPEVYFPRKIIIFWGPLIIPLAPYPFLILRGFAVMFHQLMNCIQASLIQAPEIKKQKQRTICVFLKGTFCTKFLGANWML